MSLNGLDTADVTEAHQRLLAKGEGWFLLNYTSRDEVGIFQHDYTDPTVLSSVISLYGDKSPLYGFLVFRDRKIIVKYLPEGASRLLQARTSVHWKTFAEKFTPYDAEYNAANPEDFSYDALSAVCSLSPETRVESARGTRIGSGERQSSPEPSGLASPTPAPTVSQTPFSSDLLRNTNTRATSAQSEKPSLHGLSTPLDDGAFLDTDDDDDDDDDEDVHSRVQSARDHPDSMGLRAFLTDVTPPPSVHGSGTAQVGSNHPLQTHEITRSSEGDAPKSSHSSRPSTSDIWRSFKPKVKLFPRPVPDGQTPAKQRPAEDDRQRLPPGLKAKNRTSDSDRPKSRKSEKHHATNGTHASVRPASRPTTAHKGKHETMSNDINEIASRTKIPIGNGPSSPALKALPPMPSHVRSTGSYSDGRPPAGLGIDISQSRPMTPARDDVALMSPEKQRLMKAMEIRKKQLRATEDSAATSLRNESIGERGFSSTPQSTTGKMDSAVGMDLMSLEDSARNTPRKQSGESNVTSGSSTRSVRKPNPALQSHPVRPDDACFFHASQDRRKPPPLPPPPKDISPPPPPKDATSMTSSVASSPRNFSPVPPPKDVLPKKTSAASSRRDSSPPIPPRDVSRKSSSVAQSPSAHPGTSPSVVVRGQAEKARVIDQSVASSTSRNDVNEEQSTGEVKGATKSPLDRDTIFTERGAVRVGESRRLAVPLTPSDRRGSEASAVSPAASSVVDGPWPGHSGLSTEKKHSNRRVPPSPLQPSSDGISVARKVNVSSGISRRIQALAQRSGSDSRPSSSQGPSTPISPASSFLVPSAITSHGRSDRTSIASSFESSRDVSPLVSPRSPRRPFYRQFSSESARTDAKTDDGRTSSRKRDTLSITAHIQNSNQRYGGRSPTIKEEGPGGDDLVHQQPPVKRQATSRTSFARSERPASTVSTRPPSRASTITNDIKRTSLDMWRSMGAGKKADRGHRTPTSVSNTSLDRVDEKTERRGSRPNNLLKRMSGLSAGTRKSSHSAASRRTSIVAEPTPPILSSKPPASTVGDLNVQFPDSLLWKRRWVEIDSSGNLVLSPSNETIRQTRTGPSFTSKKYHLSGFRPPIPPTQDRQELPHSVVLEFLGGGGCLQIAAEDWRGQAGVLTRLGDAHRAWMYAS